MFPDVLEAHREFNSYHSSGLNSDTYLDVKGRLRHNVQFWKYIGASDFILSIIANGYVIPFIQPPPAMFFRNNNSAMAQEVFVTDSILELLRTKRIKEVTNPYIVSPLSVVHQPSGKKRLIHDLSRLNKFVLKKHFKIDDWKVGLRFLSKESLF